MARKNVVDSHKMLDAVDMSAATNTSGATIVTHLDRASIFVDWSGADDTSTITLQAKKRKPGKVIDDADWRNLEFGTSISTSGASGSHEILFNSLDFTHLRIVITNNSNTTGTLDAVLTAKQIGG